VFETVASVRDAIEYAEVMKKPLCVVSIDFNAAFDRISHNYLEEVLRATGHGNPFLDRVMGLYRNASSEVQINGFRSSLFPIHGSIKQGCPLSMQLFAICLNPLIHTLEEALTGIRLGQGCARIAAVAYADNTTVFLTSPAVVQKLQVALRTYEEATGAKINLQNSRALAVGGWDTSSKIMDIPYHTGIKILGFHFTDRTNAANKENWRNVSSIVHASAQDAYYRDLSLDKRIIFVHDFLLARIWHVAQIFPLTTDSIIQINTAITWFF